MSPTNLANLVRIGQLKEEPTRADELDGLKRSGVSRLTDAERRELSFESRFDLAYNASHALALYALRRMGYRPGNRYLVFQTLPHTTGLSSGRCRVLAKAHQQRNAAEYEGYLDPDERLLVDVLAATHALKDLLFSKGDG